MSQQFHSVAAFVRQRTQLTRAISWANPRLWSEHGMSPLSIGLMGLGQIGRQIYR